jgi:hypothetical protein
MMVATAHQIPLAILGISSHVKLGLLTGMSAVLHVRLQRSCCHFRPSASRPLCLKEQRDFGGEAVYVNKLTRMPKH